MIARGKQFSLLLCFVSGTALAGEIDPFVGKWKLLPDKGDYQAYRLIIEEVSPNTYRFKRSFSLPTTIVADGTQQPDPNGGTTSLNKLSDSNWKLVKIAPSGIKAEIVDRISPDGQVLFVERKETKPGGEVSTMKFDYRRLGSGTGLVGTWEFKGREITGPPFELVIERYQKTGLTFLVPSRQEKQSIKFDGKDYPDTGPDVTKGSVSSGKRIDSHTIQITDKIGSSVIDTYEMKISVDGNTMVEKAKPSNSSKEITEIWVRSE